MIRVVWRSVVARWARLLLTSLAIVASTAFLAGTFVFRDTIERTFDALFADAYENVDAYVQSANSVENFLGLERRDRLPSDLVDEIAAVDGVGDAQASVQGDAVVIAADGAPLERPTAPTFGATIQSGSLSLWRIVEGRAPGPDELVLDTLTAADAGHSIGDTVKVNAEGGSRDFPLVGLAEFDELVSPGNATWALFDEETAEEFIGRPGFIDAVLVAGDGSVSADQLVANLRAALDADVAEVLTSAEITAQTQSEIEKTLSFLTVFLAVFSFIALGVGMFVIYNVFSITAAQRQRENALLRALGASRRQVGVSMLLESLVVGVLGSVAGLVAGVGLAAGVKGLLDSLGYVIPARGLVLTGSTAAVTLVSGTVASLLAAVGPAIGASRVPPVAAMGEAVLERVGSVRVRVTLAVVSAIGGAASIIGVLAGADTVLLAPGVVLFFAAVLLLGPVMARPIGRFLGAPVQRLRGVPGTMARGNVQRNPRRTARTAAPVLIGVALVAGASVFAASIKDQIRSTVGATFVGEYVINSTNGGSLSFSQVFVDRLNEVPEVGDASGLGFAFVADELGEPAPGAVIDPATAGGLLELAVTSGSLSALDATGMALSESEAAERGLSVGDTLVVRIDGELVPLEVRAIYVGNEFTPSRTYDRDTFAGTGVSTPAAFVTLTRAPGVSDEAFRAAVGIEVAAYGIGELQDKVQFIDGRADIVDRSLSFIYGLLLLSIVIAAFGIVVTLLLAVHERRREIGLLRAVGATRPQVRTTIRWESVLTSLYGAAVGVAMGLVLGWVVIVALRDEGLTTYSVPVGDVIVILVLAFVAGVTAAVVPAWRATRIDVLRAISADG
jgi:putative ABC transport system permease protein